jgi:hypothetical protein
MGASDSRRINSRHPDGEQDHLYADAERVEPVADVGDRPVVGRLDLAVLGQGRDHKAATSKTCTYHRQ